MAKSQIEGILESLVAAAADREEDAATAIFKSLLDIGRKKHTLVLDTCHLYLVKHSKLSRNHRVILLKLMENICKNHIEDVSNETAMKLISLGSAEMTQSSDVVPEWQTAASNLLSTLGLKYAKEVMQELLTKFQTGQLPHFFIVSTLGQLATSNVGEVVPLLKVVMARMLPMLGLAKLDNMQWVFSNAFARFCEAIIDYVADEQRAEASGINFQQFEGEVFSAYDTFFNVWLLSKDARLRLAVVEALGYAVHIISAEALNDQLPKLVPGVVQLYKKQSEHYYITQCLCMIMEASCKKECANFTVLLDNLLNLLHQQACAPVDFSSSMAVKNHNEVLRCFTVACKFHPQRVVSYLLTKLETNQDKIKGGTQEVFKHLMNSCDKELDDKKPLIVSGMKILLNEQSLKIRSTFGQVIITMALHHYLELEGGFSMIEFIVKQCAINPDDKLYAKQPPGDNVSPKTLKSMSANVLQIITTTMPHMHPVLWPNLLEFIGPVQYIEATPILCRCLAAIASKKRENQDDDYDIDFEDLVNLPKPARIVSSLIVLLGKPSVADRGEHILNCLQSMGPILQEELVDLWDVVIPKLLNYLNENAGCDTWDQKHWEDLILKFLSKSLDELSNEDWLLEFGNALGDKEYILRTYEQFPEEKGFLYKCLGVVMRKTTHKQFVHTNLEMMFATIRHSNQSEREGCAISSGFAASSHLDIVAEKLENVTKQDMVKKSKGFFGFGKDKTDADIERIKATVLLCYGYVCFHSPPNLITSRVEVSILRVINPHFSKVKDTIVKQNLIRTIDLIGRSVHPDHLKIPDFIFNGRSDLINHLLSYISAEPGTMPVLTETKSLAIRALTTLVKLEPYLTDADQYDILNVSTDAILPSPPLSPNTKRKDITITPEESNELTNKAIEDLTKLLIQISSRRYGSDNLESIFKHLDPWSRSSDSTERLRAMNCIVRLLEDYETNTREKEEARSLPLQVHIIGRLVPRCLDPELAIRQLAITAIQTTLKISSCIPGEEDQLVNALSLLKERAENDEASSLFSLCTDLSKVLCKKLHTEFLWPTMQVLLEGLVDYQGHSSSGACVVLNNFVKQRGSSLAEQVPDLIDGLHQQLPHVTNPQTRTGTLRCMRTLCHQYLQPVVTHLLNKPLPWDVELVSLWQVLTGDTQLMTNVIKHLLEVLVLTLPYQERSRTSATSGVASYQRTETPIPKAATQALAILFEGEECRDVSKELFSKIFSILLLRVGVSACIEGDKKNPTDPSVIAILAMRKLLEHTESEVMITFLDQQSAWSLLEKEDTYPHGCLHLARALSSQYPELILPIVEDLSSSLSSIYDPQRITVVAFYSELISTLNAETMSLAETIMNNLLGRQVDANYNVRMYCIRGLGNMADIKGTEVSKFSTTVLSAMLAGMDDREDPSELITMEAMNGLSRIFDRIDEGHVRPILINIALRIRPCFEKPTASVRAAAINLFGTLSRFGNGPSEGPFHEQIQTNFVSLLLHLNEGDPTVVMATKSSLQKLGPLIKSEKINNMFQKHLNPEDSILYADFLNDLCKLIVVDFTEKVNFYIMASVQFFKSMWPEVRGNAALFVGYMMGNLPKEKIGIVSKEHVCEALIHMLKDNSPLVRASTAEALSLLCDY
ncbi:PREDICTED: maestro heat-like repeat-containing protein family member 1 [Amphimedon queenslandica]|uniref:Maestro heat-like repeat-containing protein family member 1 n=1 Tax=Amphimedon queenslandica TaxID=400682 RepID=A0A1X7VE83_AMPQE|nr:PREDICTED: maestro heat-like repeat-containing protein family member 1 [Amphimedon queenslandica]|eukprot:XP_011410499.2 PREDICTED: maestro heat-like repeat-containing protein family member 1 [Amphimedon queenslandica]